MEIILYIESLTKAFTSSYKDTDGGKGSEQHLIVDNLCLKVPKGKIAALIGGNGAGKTTLFNIISGFVKPDKGNIKFFGNGSEYELLKQIPEHITNLGIGRMFQDNHIFPEMNVLDNMLIADAHHLCERPFAKIFFRKKSIKKEIERTQKAKDVFIKLFGEDNDFWKKKLEPAGNLSYGQKRLLGLARLFMRDYKLLLLDEPTSGVTPETVKQIIDIIRKMTDENQTVLLIEHNIDVVKEVANNCMFMDQGRILYEGSPAEVIELDEVRKSFIGV